MPNFGDKTKQPTKTAARLINKDPGGVYEQGGDEWSENEGELGDLCGTSGILYRWGASQIKERRALSKTNWS